MKANINKIVMLTLLVLVLNSCSNVVTRGVQYNKMYDEKPISIVIMPPINRTNFVEAKEYFYTTLYYPLAEKGLYVFSPYLTMDLFQQESAYDSEMFLEGDLTTFKNVLNADAAMFTIIKSWNRKSLGTAIKVNIEYILRSTTTGETLYKREGLITLDMSQNSGGGSLLGIAIDLVSTAIVSATTEKVEVGRICNTHVLEDMPVGKYDNSYLIDSTAYAGKPFIKQTYSK